MLGYAQPVEDAPPLLDLVCDPPPLAEDERLAALDRYDILDTPREEAFDRVTRLARRVFRTPMATVTLIDGHRQWFKSQQGLAASETARGPALCNLAMRADKPLIVPDTLGDPRFAENPFVVGGPGIRFYAGTPLRSSDGQPLGTFCVMDHKPRAFADDEAATLADLAQIVMDELELRLLANTDVLTGALSRRAFREEAGRAVQLANRHAHDLSVVVFDLDRFKRINDTHGHPVGDVVLARSIAACSGALRTSDVVGRIGGEEFAALLPYTGAREAMEVAERLRAAIAAETFSAGAATFQVTASFGVAARSEGVADIDALLREADAALYVAKAGGRNRCAAARPTEAAPAVPARRRVLKSGRILFNRRLASRECTIRSLWDQGAQIDVVTAEGLPDRFELSIDADNLIVPCRVVSGSDRRLELEYA